VKRKAEIVHTNNTGNRVLCVDAENKNEIMAYITKDDRHKKKFKYIAEIILNNLKNTDLYDKEDVDDKSKNVTAMKFFKGQENDRIYCKEITNGDKTFIVIMSVLFEKKKNTKLKQREINAIHKVGGYEYEIEE
jgi:hypothetical protein